MYYPIQIPFVLSERFRKNLIYTEEVSEAHEDFILCFWEITSLQECNPIVENIIIPDGCIDLIVDFHGRQIGFSGMSKTNFNFEISHPACFWGARLKPGAFHQITNLPATEVMDQFIPLEAVDGTFDRASFFSLTLSAAKAFMKEYLLQRVDGMVPSLFVTLFDRLVSQNLSINAADLYRMLHFSPRQCQRLCLKHFGISPKMMLSVIRFQQSLKILTATDVTQSDVISMVGYYDQPHYIKDIRKNIGLTPLELIKRYQ